MRVVFRPMTSWAVAGEDRTRGRRPSQFRAPWPATTALLSQEVEQLGGDQLVIELAMTEADIRTDGWPRANARAAHPAVAVSFVSVDQGPLRFATDRFEDWRDNVRAIALGLQALRAVDRYGVTSKGEQYTGWRALPAGSGDPGGGFASKEEAARFMIRTCFPNDGEASSDLIASDLIDDENHRDRMYRAAAKRLHPDAAGGTAEAFARLRAAKALLDS
jgi:hypothetical protein